MRLIRLFIFILSLVLSINLFSQQVISIPNIRNQYESFEYQTVVNLTNELLKKSDSLSETDLVELYIMKAVSHYALAEESQSRLCFVSILKIKNDIELDSEKVSPKILTLFRDVKEEYLQSIKPKQENKPLTKEDEITNKKNIELLTRLNDNFKSSFIKSLVLPGWGHLSKGDKTKGWIFSSLSLINLGSMIYFIFDTNNKEKNYINENIVSNISSKYSLYNTSYKTRNILITSYVLLWLYSQIDFLFFSENNNQINDNLILSGKPKSDMDLSINFRFKLAF